MRTRASLLVLLVCLFLDGLAAVLPDQTPIQSVESNYEGKLVRLNYALQVGRFDFELPKSERKSLGPNIRAYLQVSRVEWKKSELQFRARRVVFYRDTHGANRATAGNEENYKLRWKGAAPDSQELLAALVTLITPIDYFEADWPQYWPNIPPPVSPEEAKKRKANQDPQMAPGVYRITQDMAVPECISCPQPDYPKGMQANGEVVIYAVLLESGQLTGLTLVSSLHPRFDDSAALAAGRWRFRPAQRDGKVVATYFRIEVAFHR